LYPGIGITTSSSSGIIEQLRIEKRKSSSMMLLADAAIDIN